MSKEASLSEVFTSFQGEGPYLGQRQIFVRFAGCNLSCQYCDTPQALEISKEYKVELVPGSRKFEKRINPITVEELFELVKLINGEGKLNHSISLTGGEPLMQVDFLKQFIPEIKKLKLPIYLETNGVLPKHLEEIIDLVDIVAFDIKLPSATGLSSYYKEHLKALEIAFTKEVFVKAVFTRDSKAKEIDEACEIIASISDEIPLILQPVTPYGIIKHAPLPEQMNSFYLIARRRLKNVRVVPQVHKILGII